MVRFTVVKWQKSDGIGLVTLNRPEKLNAMNPQLLADLREILEEAEKDEEVKVLVLTGTGKGFCAGGDVEEHPGFKNDNPLIREKYLKEVQHVTLLLHRMPKPVIAAINGIAAGGGLDMAMACDIRIASEEALFTEVSVRAGLMPDMGGTYFLPRLVGVSKALEMIFTGDTIDAQEALRIGLVNQVAPDQELINRAMAMAKRLAQGPSQSYRFCKWAVYRGLDIELEAALEHELFGQNLLLDTEDVQEANKAFAEKRKPIFKGR